MTLLFRAASGFRSGIPLKQEDQRFRLYTRSSKPLKILPNIPRVRSFQDSIIKTIPNRTNTKDDHKFGLPTPLLPLIVATTQTSNGDRDLNLFDTTTRVLLKKYLLPCLVFLGLPQPRDIDPEEHLEDASSITYSVEEQVTETRSLPIEKQEPKIEPTIRRLTGEK